MLGCNGFSVTAFEVHMDNGESYWNGGGQLMLSLKSLKPLNSLSLAQIQECLTYFWSLSVTSRYDGSNISERAITV